MKLTEEEQLSEMQARKESSNYLRSAYKCERCFKGFLSETTYENHQKKTHEPVRIFVDNINFVSLYIYFDKSILCT